MNSSYDGSRSGGKDDLMGAHGDALFADPLGIRKEKPKQPASSSSSQAQSSSIREPQRRPDRDETIDDSRNRPIVQEEPPASEGPLQSWFGYIFGGGTQCCGNRDRNKDAELARKAALNGRPPQPRQPAAPSNDRRRDFEVSEPPSRADTAPPSRMQSEPPSRDPPRAGGGLDELHKFANEPLPNGQRQPPLPPPADSTGDRLPSPQEPPQRLRPPEESIGTNIVGKSPLDNGYEPTAEENRAALAREKPPEGHMPHRWQWPTWTLNSKDAQIEVYVTDEDTGESRWCKAVPQFRVVDKDGHDAYICAEYDWDEEYYVQDFGPHHVRRRGQKTSIFEMFSLDPNDTTMQDTRGPSMKNATDPFMTSVKGGPANDSGGGVSDWMRQ